jgi:hypothetical protein
VSITGSRTFFKINNLTMVSSSIRKQVSFGETSTLLVETVPISLHSLVWYSVGELQKVNREERASTTACYESNNGSKASLELAGLSWRGMEHVQKGYRREAKIHLHLVSVVEEYYTLVYAMEQDYNPEELRRFSKAFSKADRVRARKLGAQDAAAAEKAAGTKSFSRGRFGLKWFHKELSTLKARTNHRVSNILDEQ